MNSLFNPDNPILNFFSRVFDIIYLNFLCLICCIPIITIGPSFTALYYCMFKILRKRDSSISNMFSHSFKSNLKQGISVTVFFIVITLFLLADFYICNHTDIEHLQQLKLILYIILFIFIGTVSYTFPVLAQFDNTSKNIIRYAFLLAVYNWKYTFIITFLNSFPILLFILNVELFMFTLFGWITFGVSLVALINSTFFLKIFNKFVLNYKES